MANELDAQGTPPRPGFSICLFISAEGACVEHYPSVLYSVRCLDGNTFQIEWLLMDQSQKSLRQSKTQDFFAAK